MIKVKRFTLFALLINLVFCQMHYVWSTIHIFGDSHAIFCFNNVDQLQPASTYFLHNVMNTVMTPFLQNREFNSLMYIHRISYSELPIYIFCDGLYNV